MLSKGVWMALVLAVLAVPASGVSAGDHGDDGDLHYRVKVERLSGLNRWLGEVVVTATMALMGAVIAVLADVVLKRLGLDAKRMSHRE